MVIKFPMLDSGDRRMLGGVAIDVTEQKRAEEAERQSEKRFRDLFEKSPDAILVGDLEGKVLDVNAAACRLHNFNRENLIGKSVYDLVPADKREEVSRALPRLLQGEPINGEGWSLTSDKKCV